MEGWPVRFENGFLEETQAWRREAHVRKRMVVHTTDAARYASEVSSFINPFLNPLISPFINTFVNPFLSPLMYPFHAPFR